MKLTSVEIHPEDFDDMGIVLSFRDPGSTNPYNVKGIVGLDADEIVSRYYGGSGNSKMYSLTMEKREVVIRIGLNPRFEDSETYSDLRDNVYKMISASRKARLHIHLNNGEETLAHIHGSVKKLEAPHFEKAQEIQITVKCDEAMLTAVDPVEVVVAGLNPASTSIQDDLSTAPHGFIFDLAITAPFASLMISDPDDDAWVFQVSPIGSFLTGDVLHFSSKHNDKQLYIVRGASIIQLADVITPGSIWPILFPGPNNFSLSNPTKVDWDAISYYPTYWGV